MQKFYNISTTDFRPISFESVYLYGEYKKIKNFLLSNNKQELLKVLAIPSYKNNNIVWSANTNNEIKKLDQYSKTQQNKILSEYNEFLNSYNNFVNNLRSSKNQDNKNWGELLFSLIEGTANELFFDGKLVPMLQTNRGCPFLCTYCTDGNSAVNMVNKFSKEIASAPIIK